MPGRPSGGACGRCRARHLKCGEEQPECSRCLASKISCPGYIQELKFYDQGAGLRRKYKYDESPNASTGNKRSRTLTSDQDAEFEASQVSSAVEEDPKTSYLRDNAYENSPSVPTSATSPRADIPLDPRLLSELTTSHVDFEDPNLHRRSGPGSESFHNMICPENLPSHTALIGLNGLELLQLPTGDVGVSSVNDALEHSPQQFKTRSTEDLLSATLYSVFQRPTRVSIRNIPVIQNGMVYSKIEGDTDFETLFLIRHFAEVVGPWMDLYDPGNYFAFFVPFRSVTCPLLRCSAAAIAAKQLGRVNGKTNVSGGLCSKQASTEIYPNCEQVDWLYVAAQFYDKAIALLREGLIVYRSPLQDFSEHSSRRSSLSYLGDSEGGRSPVNENETPPIKADDLLSATSILSVYEFMDDSNIEWSRHLSGVKSLLDEAHVNVMGIRPSRAQIATFWNFARCDYLAAYINHTATRLDTEDLPLWRAAGLLIGDDGTLRPELTRRAIPGSESMIANALIWILSKIMNFLAHGSEARENSYTQWQRLQIELDFWHSHLPNHFKPYGQLPPEPTSTDPARIHFFETLYSIPSCSVTMQHYLFAQILLILHMPQKTYDSVGERLRNLREIPEKITSYSRSIVAIALARPPGFVRIHMLQPLFVAGQCLEQTGERKVIMSLLRGIERDLGWATEYRVKQLLNEWGWGNECLDR